MKLFWSHIQTLHHVYPQMTVVASDRTEITEDMILRNGVNVLSNFALALHGQQHILPNFFSLNYFIYNSGRSFTIWG